MEAHTTTSSTDECLEEAIDTVCIANVEATVLIPDELVECYAKTVGTASEKVKCTAERGYDAATPSDLTICSVCVHNIALLVLGKASLGGADVNVPYKFKCPPGVVCNTEGGGLSITSVIVPTDIGLKTDEATPEEPKGMGNTEP